MKLNIFINHLKDAIHEKGLTTRNVVVDDIVVFSDELIQVNIVDCETGETYNFDIVDEDF